MIENQIIRISSEERAPLFSRFLKRVKKTETCWIWIGGKNQGYGQLRWKGRIFKSHRLAYLIFNGELDAKKVLHHSCENKVCVNPTHLTPMTIGEHAGLGENPSAINKRRLECKNGHPFRNGNLFFRHDGSRGCLKCLMRPFREKTISQASIIKEQFSLINFCSDQACKILDKVLSDKFGVWDDAMYLLEKIEPWERMRKMGFERKIKNEKALSAI